MMHPSSEPRQKYGFYSATHAAKFGSSIYITATGEQVQVTYVTDLYSSLEEISSTYKWPDTEFVGPVEKCVKSNDMLSFVRRDGMSFVHQRDVRF